MSTKKHVMLLLIIVLMVIGAYIFKLFTDFSLYYFLLAIVNGAMGVLLYKTYKSW